MLVVWCVCPCPESVANNSSCHLWCRIIALVLAPSLLFLLKPPRALPQVFLRRTVRAQCKRQRPPMPNRAILFNLAIFSPEGRNPGWCFTAKGPLKQPGIGRSWQGRPLLVCFAKFLRRRDPGAAA